MSNDREPCHVATFRFGDDIFEHHIFPQERDQVELVNRQGETLLEFSNDLIVKDPNGVVGHIVLEGPGRQWVFYERPLQTRVVSKGMVSLLDFEVEISKRYLQAQREATLVESEGGLCD